MSSDYKKIPQLPVGLDEQQNVLLGGSSSGSNFAVVDGVEYQKRPGLRPVVAQIATDATASAYISTLLAPRGVMAAAEYVVGNQLRQNSYERLVGSSDTLYIYNDTQIVCIIDGRPVVIRKIPVLYITGTTTTYRVGINPTTSALEFATRDISTGVETALTIGESTTLGDLVSGSVVLVDSVYSNKNSVTSCMPGLSGLPASCLATSSGIWLNLDPANNFIYGYVPFEMPLSSPQFPLSPTMPSRCFYTQDVAGRDGNIVALQFQEEMLFAGRGDALMSFDGYRMSVAGCSPIAGLNIGPTGVGGLSAGTYKYLAREKITKPSGQVTYGPPIMASSAANLNDAMSVSLGLLTGEISARGSDYSGVAYSPRRRNKLLNVGASLPAPYNISEADAARIRPQIGERLGGSSAFMGNKTGDIKVITDVTRATYGNPPGTVNLQCDLVEDLGYSTYLGLGEEWEIYRTVANGSTYYLVFTMPTGAIILDLLADANLVASTPYVAKTYAIQRPPDCCIAVGQHQNRIIVLGEYLETPNGDDATTVTLSTNRPYIKTVYWSTPNSEEFSPTNSVILDVALGDELNSVLSVGNILYVGGGESMWAIQGNLGSATSYTVSRLPGASGTVGNTAITALGGQVFAVSRSGLYALSGASASYAIGAPINALIRALKPELLPFIRLITLKQNAGLALIMPGMVFERAAVKLAAESEVFPASFIATEDANDTVALIYDQNTKSWALWSGAEMFMGGGLVEHDGLTWAFPRKESKPICILDSKYGYDGFTTPVEMVLKGPWQSDDDTFADKNFARLRVICAAPGRQNFTLHTKIERNWEENQAWQECDIGFRAAQGYGQIPYGTTAYGDPNVVAQQVALTSQKALSVRAVFENSNPAEFPSITGWNFEVGENRKNMKQE